MVREPVTSARGQLYIKIHSLAIFPWFSKREKIKTLISKLIWTSLWLSLRPCSSTFLSQSFPFRDTARRTRRELLYCRGANLRKDSLRSSGLVTERGNAEHGVWRWEGGSYVGGKFRVDTRVARTQLSQLPSERYVMHVERRKHCFMQRATLQRRGDELRPRGPSQNLWLLRPCASHGPPGRIRQPRGPFVTAWYWTRVQDLGKRISDAKRLAYRPNDERAPPLFFFILCEPSSVNVEH